MCKCANVWGVPYFSPKGTVDSSSVATGEGTAVLQEIKEWQAIMDYLSTLPVIPVDERAAEVRAIKVG
jgi:5'-nucleotidase/UDP-sugar diphosphatase